MSKATEGRAVWNARFDQTPRRVCLARSTDDVMSAVRSAAADGVDLTVIGGGHSYAGNSAASDGLLLDLAGLDAIRADPKTRRILVGPGARWAAVDTASQAHGLATTGGTVSTVGVSGFTLGGGDGWLSRKHGLACDNLRRAQVVTADGELVRADEDHNADLFWALRGGSGNFGVVTEFEFELHPLSHEILAGQVLYPFERAAEALRLYRDVFEADPPDELACFPFIYRVPPIDPFPARWHGQLVVAFVLAYMGPLGGADRTLAPFRHLDDVIADWLGPVPYQTLQQSFDAGMGSGFRWYTRSHNFDRLTDDAIDTLLACLEPFPGDFTAVYFGPGGGAVGRRAVDDTAYPHRKDSHYLHIFPGWTDSAADEEIRAWTRVVFDAMTPFANGGVYVNLLAEDEAERVPRAYGANYSRLRAIKHDHDPTNLFRGNHNIPPRAPGSAF